MNAWTGLLKKEFRTTRTFVLVTLGMLAVFMIAAYLLSIRAGHPAVMFGLAFIPIGLHSGYMLVYMLLSLNAESKKLHLWLHTPQSAVNLLLAKLFNGILGFLLSMSASIIFLIYATNSLDRVTQLYYHLGIGTGFIIQGVSILAFSILLGSLIASFWVVSAWVIHQTFKAYIGRWSIIGAIVFLFVLSYVSGLFETTQLYHTLFDWGYFSLTDLFSLHALNWFPAAEAGQIGPVMVPLGAFVYHLIVGLLLFSLSCVLLDKKVEV